MSRLYPVLDYQSQVVPRPLSTTHVTVGYDLADPEALLDLAREIGATVGHGWASLKPYAYITQQRIQGEWHAFVDWGSYDTVMYQARARFDAPPLDGLADGAPLPAREQAA